MAFARKSTARKSTARNSDKPARDTYQEVTDKIVAAIEAGSLGRWEMPWHKVNGSTRLGAGSMPVSVDGHQYKGINVPLLWIAAASKGYASNIWGTYKAFQGKGAQVKKDEKATLIVFMSKFTPKPKPGQKPEDVRPIMFAKSFPVFNVDQVDGYKGATVAAPVSLPPAGPERIAYVESFFAALNIDTRHGGDRAYYSAMTDHVQMPHLAQFKDNGGYYATLGHEYVHATGHKARLDRDLTGRFGSESYAVEELVAELGAAFTCAMLGLDNEPRPDHAKYLQSWLNVLKADKRAIFTAASTAQKAVDYLTGAARDNAADGDDMSADDDESEALPLAA